MDVVRDHLVLANVTDADGVNPWRVRWSEFNDPLSWTPGTNQADFQDLKRDGYITAFQGGDYGLIWQERAITRMDYVGPPVIFDFNRVEREQGTIIPGSVIQFQNQFAYLGQDGFFIFDGQRSIPIGDGKVDDTFYRNLDQSSAQNVSGAVDSINQILLWAVPMIGNTDGIPNEVWMYNYSQAPSKTRWSRAAIEVEHLAEFLSESYTLEQLDTLYSSVEDIPFSLDSRFWAGGNLITAAFDRDHKAGGFTGAPLPAILETQEFQPQQDRRSRIHKARPIIDTTPGNIAVELGVRSRAQDHIVWGRSAPVGASGDCSVRGNGWYFRLRARLDSTFKHALGIQPLKITDAGER